MENDIDAALAALEQAPVSNEGDDAVLASLEENFFNGGEDVRTVHEAFADMQERNPGATIDEFCSTLTTTDTGNAERLEVRFADMLRYIPARKKDGGTWIGFNGVNWARESLVAAELMKRTVKMIPRELRFEPEQKAGEDDKAFAKRLASWRDGRMKFATRSLGARAMEDALKVARINLRARETDFDNSPELLNTPTGTFCLKTGFWNKNSPEDMLTGITASSPRIGAPRAEWEMFIRDICKNALGAPDLEKERYLKILLGYCLLGRNPEHLIFFFTGDETDEGRNGRNGKSLLMEVIRFVLGDDYATEFEREMLVRVNGHDPESKHRHCLLGRRIAFSPEYKREDVICSATMKRLVGEARFTGRYLNNDPFTANMTATLIVVSQYIPEMSSNAAAAVWSKVRRIRFLNRFWDGKTDKPKGHYQMIDLGLEARLKAEADGILSWLIEGAVEYAQNGFPQYEDAIASLNATRADADSISDFLESCVVRTEGQRVPSNLLYSAYFNFCHKNSIEPKSITAFGRAATSKSMPVMKDGGVKYRCGIRLNIIGDAFSRNEDPKEAAKFIAHEMLPGDDAKAKGLLDPEADFFDEPAAEEPAAPSRVRRVIRGNELSDEELNRVVSAEQGARFTLADGAVFRIVVPGQALPLDLTNLVPMRRGARG